MPEKVKGKGTVFSMDVATSLTAIASVISISDEGAENETYDATTLDQTSAGKTMLGTGYTEPGTLSLELFFDPVLAGHQEFTDRLKTPLDDVDATITFADAGTTTHAFVIAGVGFGTTIVLNDGVKASVTLTKTGVEGYP